MANLITNSEKSRGNNAVALLLPFERYVQSITNLEERKRLCDTCKQAIGIRSDTQLWNCHSIPPFRINPRIRRCRRVRTRHRSPARIGRLRRRASRTPADWEPRS